MKNALTLILTLLTNTVFSQITDANQQAASLFFSGSFELKAKDSLNTIKSTSKFTPIGCSINVPIDQIKRYLNSGADQIGADELIITVKIDSTSKSFIAQPELYLLSIATMDEINNQVVNWADTSRIKLIKQGSTDFKKGKKHVYQRNFPKHYDDVRYVIAYDCSFYVGLDGSKNASYSINRIYINNRSIEDFMKSATTPAYAIKKQLYNNCVDDISALLGTIKAEMPGNFYKFIPLTENNNSDVFRP